MDSVKSIRIGQWTEIFKKKQKELKKKSDI